MSRQLFVWRMTPGPRAGAPCEPSLGQREAAHRPRESGHPAQGPLDATGALADVLDELSHGRLRCGWWVAHPAVDGRLDTPSGCERDRMAGQHDGASDPEPSHAMGDRPVWCRLREMSAGDVVFLPKSPDDGHFMVTTVQRPDACDWATVVDEAEADGSHDGRLLIGVADTMRYAYGSGTLYPDLFEAPCREAIQRIPEDDPSYRSLEEFLRSWGR
jgi:hypothetical protein